MHMVSGQQCLVSVLQYFSRAHSPRFAWLSFLLLMVGPGSGMLFCWLASKPIHLRASVEPANGSTRKGHARLWGGDFPSRLPSKSSQCFVFPQTSVLPKMLRPDPKRSHPSCNASELRHSISQYLFSPSLWSYCPRKMLAKVLGERAKCSEGRNRCMWRTPWSGNAGKNMGALRWEGTQWTKGQGGIFFLLPKGRFLGTSLVTLESTLLTVSVSSPRPLPQELVL